MTNKKIITFLKVFLTILVILWAISVFILSNQNGDESSNLSGRFIEKILEIKDNISKKDSISNTNANVYNVVNIENTNNNNKDNSNNKINSAISKDNKENVKDSKEEITKSKEKINKKRIQKWQKVTRKMAHYTLYTIGGFLIYCMIMSYSKNEKITKKKIFLSIIIGAIYAVFDEIHQFFSAGRTPRIFDVGIDSLGVLTGIIIAIIIIGILNKIINYIYERRKKVND